MKRKLTALTIGIAGYPNGAELKNPSNDADDMEQILSGLGFSVIKLNDATCEDIDRSLESFKDNLNSNDVGLFYFAGHAIQIKGENYLNTVDTNFIDEISAKHTSFPLDQIIETMDSCSNKTNIIILDACRNNPFVRSWNRSADQGGLASVYTPRGTIIAFSTSPGEKAKDGKGRNGSYTEALIKHINTQDITIEDLFKRVRNTLSVITDNEQTSWEHTSLSGDFFFNLSVGRSVSIYSVDAIADSNFQLQPSTKVKLVISKLKSLDWYTQNPAFDKLSTSDFNNADADELFVLGRNIYQSACGSARSLISFINNFRSVTAKVAADKRKSILDGMLFEVFFNSDGEIRESFKMSMFNDLFALQQHPEFQTSFDFISELLMTYQNRFYVIPGKTRGIHLDVTSVLEDDDEYLIKEVHFEGFNIFKEKDGVSERIKGRLQPINMERLKLLISSEMVIPVSQISFTASFDKSNSRLLIPYGMTFEK